MEIIEPDPELLSWAGHQFHQGFVHGKGCKQCRDTGYKGRTGVFELLNMNDDLKRLINEKQYSELEVRQTLHQGSFLSLKQEGLRKVEHHITTLDEVARVVK